MSESPEFIAEGVRAERAGALDRALEAYVAAADSAVSSDTLAEALTHQADVHRTRCDWNSALLAAQRAQDIASSAGLPQRHAEAVIAEANILISRGEFDAAIPKLEEIATSSTDPRLRGIALQNLGSMHAQTGHPRAAERAFSESLGNFHKAGYSRGEAIALNNLGRLALDSDDAERSQPLLERALSLAREVEDSDLAALVGLNLASALCKAGDNERSQDLAMAALGYFSTCGNSWREIECLRLIGDINVRCEDITNASRCYHVALKLAEQVGSDVEIQTTRDRIASLPRH